MAQSDTEKYADSATIVDVIIDRLGHFLISVKKKFDKFSESSKSGIHVVSKDNCTRKLSFSIT
jgi:hypothetical protein